MRNAKTLKRWFLTVCWRAYSIPLSYHQKNIKKIKNTMFTRRGINEVPCLILFYGVLLCRMARQDFRYKERFMNTPTNSMKFRAKITMTAIFTVLFSVIVYQFFKIAVLDNAEYQERANDYHFGPITISAHRGSIYDANGTPLARSASVYKVFLDPTAYRTDLKSLQKEIDEYNAVKNNPDYKENEYDLSLPVTAESYRIETVGFLADKLGIKIDTVEKAMAANNQYSILQSQVEKPIADEILEYFGKYNFSSIHVEEDTKRYYPQNEVAASVIGFTNADGDGAYGLEAYYNDYLSGVDGKTISAKDSNGKEMPYRYAKTYAPKNGNDLHLTINTKLQYYLEKHLNEMITEFNVQNRACAILMNAKTGAIYGMASCEGYDLNNPYEIYDTQVADEIAKLTGDESKEAISVARETQWKNKAISEIYEPGSVFKVITSAAAIEEKLINLETGDNFTCNGAQEVAGATHPIKCHKTSGHGPQDFFIAITNSCNPAFIQIGQRLGIEKFCYYFEAFGLTEKTGIDLPGEAKSFYIDKEKMTNVDLASSSFGQANAITPIEMITAYAAVINGGYLLEPYVVSKVVDGEKNVILENKRTVKRQVISEETSATMRKALETVVTKNPGGNVYLKGYRIGGKSGTSQKLGMTGEDEDAQQYVASYVCFAPADDPEIILLVMADMPDKTKEYYGSKVAVPAARDIMADVLIEMGYYPEYSAEELEHRDVKVPLLQGKAVSDAQATVQGLGLEVYTIGEGSTVVAQSPITGSSVANDGCVYLYTEENYETEYAVVPDLKGVTASQANESLAYRKLNFLATGSATNDSSATVESQSIAAGSQVPKGTVVELTFKASADSD